MKRIRAWLAGAGDWALVTLSMVLWVLAYVVTLVGVFVFWVAFNAVSGTRGAWRRIWKATRRKKA